MDLDRAARIPRPIAIFVIAAIAGATAVSFAWPTLTRAASEPPSLSLPTGAGVIRRQIDEAGHAPRISARAPDFEWNAPDGRTRRLQDLHGKTLVVNFWATWCVPCRQEMPALDGVAQRDGDLVVLAVDLQEPGTTVREFFDRYELKAIEPLLDLDGATTRRWGVVSLPTTFFVDRDGVIRHLVVGGPMTEEAIANGVAKARPKP